MAEESLRKKATKSVMWLILQTGCKHLIGLGISVVLARLIAPEQFGAIAMLTIFTAVAGAFVDSGFTTALMRSKEKTQLECCTVFYFNITIAVAAYIILFFSSPWVADFYDMPILKSVLRVTALGLIIGSLCAVQGTLLQAELRFKALTKYNLLSQIIAGTVGIVMAFKGFGVWALVAQSLTSSVSNAIFMWYVSSWRPSLMFSFAVLKQYFSFGSKLLASGLLDQIYNNMYGVIIGKIFKAADLAFYNRANNLRQFTSSLPTGILGSVTYPVLCKVQDDDERLRRGYRQMLQVSAFVIFPLSMGMGSVAYPLINTMYGERWIYAATLLQIVVFAGMWYPIHAINLNLLIVKGRSDLFFRLEVIKKIIGVAMLCITVPLGLEAMCYGGIVTSILCLYVNSYYTGKILSMTIFKQLYDMFPSLLLSLVMFVCCKLLATYLGNGIVSLVATIALGIVIYTSGALLFRFKEVAILKSLVKKG